MRFLIAATVAVSLALAGSAVVGAQGNNPAHRNDTGWSCFNVPGLGVHCQSPGAEASSATLPLLVYATDDPDSATAPFHATELLLRADLYHGQPCPSDGLDEYDPIDFDMDGNPDYYACHHPKGG